MIKATCDYIIVKGSRKGQKCDTPCETAEGKEQRCFRHKSKYLEKHNQKQKEKAEYQTKKTRICELERDITSCHERIDMMNEEIESLRQEKTLMRQEMLSALQAKADEMREENKQAASALRTQLALRTALIDEVIKRLGEVEGQCKELSACSIKKTTKELIMQQIANSTKQIDSIMKYISERNPSFPASST